MSTSGWIFVGSSALFLLLGASTLVLLDRYAGYRSPLYRSDEGSTPRAAALHAEREEAEQRAMYEEEGNASDESSTVQMVELGREIVFGKGLCLTCHRVDGEGTGTLGPDLAGVGARASERLPDLSDVEYLAQKLYRPDVYTVEGYVPAMMSVNGPPMRLTDQEILQVVAFLQSLGGTPSVTSTTDLSAFQGEEPEDMPR